jgi:hypothetical protein
MTRTRLQTGTPFILAYRTHSSHNSDSSGQSKREVLQHEREKYESRQGLANKTGTSKGTRKDLEAQCRATIHV